MASLCLSASASMDFLEALVALFAGLHHLPDAVPDDADLQEANEEADDEEGNGDVDERRGDIDQR